MSLPRKAFGVQVDACGLMAVGLRSNLEQLARRGMTEEFVSEFEIQVQELNRINHEQEKLKAELITKTAEFNKQLALLDKQFSEAKKVVKLEMARTSWKEFGVADKR